MSTRTRMRLAILAVALLVVDAWWMDGRSISGLLVALSGFVLGLLLVVRGKLA